MIQRATNSISFHILANSVATVPLKDVGFPNFHPTLTILMNFEGSREK